MKFFSGSEKENTGSFLLITPGEQSSVYISMSNVSKTRIGTEEKLYATDKSVSVEAGYAKWVNERMKIDIDSNSEVSYKAQSASGDTLSVSKWRLWVETIGSPVSVALKNFTVNIAPRSVVLVEQTGPFSSAYALSGDITIDTKIGEKKLNSGMTVKLLASDLISPSWNIDSWMTRIDGSVMNMPIFVRNDGKNLLETAALSLSWSSLSWWVMGSGDLIPANGGKFIEITEPKANTLIKTSSLTIMGNLLSKDVKKVTINNKDATISPVNETFVFQNFEVTSDVVDIVYKAFDASNTLLESWVMTLYGNKNTTTPSWQLIPETFPISAKDFRITSPLENPYKTTETFVKVQWTVPKNTVEYVMVNDYRLQKYIPNGTTWYYFANMANNTMEEGINMYTIKFYNKNKELIYNQVFTLIKESKNAISGEISQ